MENNDKRLFLLDAMALIYRAFYALNKNPRINSKGLNTSAIVGFANTLYDVLKNEKPTHIAVAFDTQAATLRHDEYVHYKANRQEMPEDLAKSIPYIKQLVEAFGIPVLFVEGYEADDVIGTLAKEAERQGFTTFMMTPDKDFGQLVSENIFIYKPAKFGEKAEILGVKEVCEKFSIERPEQLIDILGIWGDASDNIPGIPGIGEVGAKKLISQFGSLENILENIDKVENPKLKEKIVANAEMAIQSKMLATIILDVPVEFNEKKLIMSHPDEAALKKLFDELEFRTFAKRVFTDLSLKKAAEVQKIQAGQPDLFSMMDSPAEEEIDENEPHFDNIKNTEHKYFLIDTVEKRKELIAELKKHKIICFDTETTGIDPNNAEIVGLSFSVKPFEAYYIPFSDNYAESQAILAEFKEIFADMSIEKVGQNIKFDIEVLKWYDVEVKGKLFDTMIAHYLIQPDLAHNLDFLSRSYLNYEPVPIESLIGKKGKNQLSMRTVEIDTIKEYASEDADVALRLMEPLKKELADNGATKLFDEIETPLIPVLASMETEGVKIDINALNEFSESLREDIIGLEREIYQDAGVSFNISSPKQLGDILFTNLKVVDNAKMTTTKQFKTGEEVLIKLVNKHPIIQKILDYRSLTKLKSTYVDSLPQLLNPRTGRIHTSFNQAIVSTGRLSSNNPNLQNIPIRTEKGREIRKAFVPRNEDYVLMSADYSQIELRIIADISLEENMMNDFKSGHDIHTATASRVYGIPMEEVTKEMRRKAKTVNFGIIYGISAFGLSERLNIPRREAADIIEQYFAKYPSIKKYMDDTIEFAKNHGYVETLMGRRRYLKDIYSGNAMIRGFAERNAINAPIQGTAADMIKIAMINIYKFITDNSLRSKMTMQVHDELVFDVHKDEIELLKPVIIEKMRSAIPLNVPVEIDLNIGKNWLEAH
jgi:DNA polymerase-1